MEPHMKTVEFHYGALADSYEKQANDQGYTLGERQEYLEKLGFCLVFAHIHDCLTDSQYDAALKKLQKQIVKALKPLNTARQEET